VREPHLGSVTPQCRLHDVAPLDEHDVPLEQLVERKVVHFLHALEPVYVNVRDRYSPVVLLHDRERRTRDGFLHAQGTGYTLDKRRLPCTKVADE
jgi:hypothetical protein